MLQMLSHKFEDRTQGSAGAAITSDGRPVNTSRVMLAALSLEVAEYGGLSDGYYWVTSCGVVFSIWKQRSSKPEPYRNPARTVPFLLRGYYSFIAPAVRPRFLNDRFTIHYDRPPAIKTFRIIMEESIIYTTTHNFRRTTMSIATTRGDGGETGLAGGIRISKADLRVESYGTVDELNSVLGFARSICQNPEIKAWTETIQRTLFRLGAALATPPESRKQPPIFLAEDVTMLTELVHKIEAVEGILSDWSLPGAHTESAAYEVARTVCRRAERNAIRFIESGGVVEPEVIAYLNRLSDVIWLFGRLIEFNAGVDARLRDETKMGPKWSRAW